MISSVMPSARYAFLESGERLSKYKTATRRGADRGDGQHAEDHRPAA